MERNKDTKKRSLAAVNGIGPSRQRHRITALRDSPEEQGLMEKARSREQERVHKVDRAGDRDQKLKSQRKKRRGRSLERSTQRDVEGGGDDDSSVPSGEENHEEDYGETSSSMSNHARPLTVISIRNGRSMLGMRIADEMIGAAVPRRARSALVKRSNKQWNSSPWRFWERQTRSRLSQSPFDGSVDIVSPSSSSVSLRRKMKPLRPKDLIYKVSRKPLPSAENDIEIEVAEALFDLMKQSQSHSSKKDKRIRDNISTENLELIGNDDFHTKSVHSPTTSGQIGPEAADMPPEMNSKSIASPLCELNTESGLKFRKMSIDALEPPDVSPEKGKDSSEPAQESVGGDKILVAEGEESTSFEKSNGGVNLDSRMLKVDSASEVLVPLPHGEANFEIDLMAPRPIPPSPDQEGSKIRVPEPEQEISSYCYNSQPEPNHHSMASDSKRQNVGCSISFPSLSGYIPFKTLLPMDEISRTTAPLIAPFTLSHPPSKRCVTHQYIACNIRQHQQLSKNCVLPPATTGHASLHEAKPNSGNHTTSTLNSFLGNPLQIDSSGRHAFATHPVLSEKCKSSEVVNANATECKKLVPQLTFEKAPAGNLLQPALIFPMGQHQVANMAAQKSGSNKSTAIGKAPFSSTSAGVPVLGSLSLPAGGASMSFNSADLSGNDAAPLMTILQNNVHPYLTSANGGMPLSIRGAHAPVFPLLNAPYNPSIFTLQNQQDQSTCQYRSKSPYQVQHVSSFTGICSGSKSSYKKSNSQQQIVTQTSTHNSFGSEGLQLEQSRMKNALGSHSSSNSGDSPRSDAQKDRNGQNHGFPFQAMNFALVSHANGNQQQPKSECSVAVIPSQAVGFSFDWNASTNMEFSLPAPPQETAVVQMLSDVTQLGYRFAPSAQVAQHKKSHVAEKENVVKSTNADGEKKTLLAKSVDQSLKISRSDSSNLLASGGKKVAFDGSASSQSFFPAATTRYQSFVSSSAPPTAAISITALKSQQEQQLKEMIQLQKQCTQQIQLTSTAQIQAPIPNNFLYSFNGCKNPNNSPMFSLVHNNIYAQSSHWKNISLATTSQVPSLAATSSLKNLPQQQSRNSKGQPHVSCESSLNSTMSLQGQQFIINSQPTSSIVEGHLEVVT